MNMLRRCPTPNICGGYDCFCSLDRYIDHLEKAEPPVSPPASAGERLIHAAQAAREEVKIGEYAAQIASEEIKIGGHKAEIISVDELTHKPGGRHLLIDLHGCKGSYGGYCSILTHEGLTSLVCKRAAEATGATIISSNFHSFGKGQGLSGVIVLAESHLSIHTWPETGLATVDVFVCGECDPWAAVAVLMESFLPETITTQEVKRGIL